MIFFLILSRLFRISLHNNFAQPNDVFAEDVILENSEGPIDGVEIRKRIYSGILEGMCFLLCTGGPRTRLFRFFYPILLIKLFFFYLQKFAKMSGQSMGPIV